MKPNWWDLSTIRGPQEKELAIEESYALIVLDGPEAGTRFVFQGTAGTRVLVGKSPACDLCLKDRQVSRRHAAFELARKGVRVTDLESTNGTTVNGIPIGEAYVRDGDRIRVGETTLGIEKGEAKLVRLTSEMRFGRMLGASKAMRRLYPLCTRLAESELPVLIEGETGTGKEVLAEALHEASPRAKGPFIVFDCTAVPPTLMESTLFGHERGSFTGAVGLRKGVFEEAHGGTLFIDELGELDLALQPKLLRALERSEVQRVGSNQWTRVDVRIIAATRRDLEREVQAGRFRDDLFFRLAVGRIELPPLRHRAGDIELLASHFWQALGGANLPMPRDLIQRFEDYRWPGNLRELHNAVARALALGETEMGYLGALERPAMAAEREENAAASMPPGAPATADVIETVLASDLPLARAREQVVSEFERRYVERVLARYDGNVVRAAAASGIARRYFQILRARYKSS